MNGGYQSIEDISSTAFIIGSVDMKWLCQLQGTHCTGKTGKMAKEIPCQGKHREFGNFAKTQGIEEFCQNTGNFVCSSCKFPYSKGSRYFNNCCENFHLFSEAGKDYKVSFVYVIVTNHVNWHRENLCSDREKNKENTGNLKMQFERVPCSSM